MTVITKFKAYGAFVGALLSGLAAVLVPNTQLAIAVSGLLAILAGLGVYNVPYERTVKSPHLPPAPYVPPQ